MKMNNIRTMQLYFLKWWRKQGSKFTYNMCSEKDLANAAFDEGVKYQASIIEKYTRLADLLTPAPIEGLVDAFEKAVHLESIAIVTQSLSVVGEAQADKHKARSALLAAMSQEWKDKPDGEGINEMLLEIYLRKDGWFQLPNGLHINAQNLKGAKFRKLEGK
jgi:hypothetical protein